MLEQAKRLFTSALDLLAITAEEMIERAHGNSREELQERLREAAERGAQLALEKAALEDKLDELRFNGPSLWSDEVRLLRSIVSTMQENIKANGFADLAEAGKNLQVMQHLLDRCDHMPMTAEEMGRMADEAIKDCNAHLWDDGGVDVDQPPSDPTPCDHRDSYGSLMMDGRCMVCGTQDDDPYEGSWREAADNEGARLAAESRGEDDDIPF